MADKKLTKEKAIKVFKNVEDPELNIDIWTLGLIYGFKIKKDNQIDIDMTFTTPACPYAPQLVSDLENKLRKAGFTPELEFVFDPPWEPSDEVKDLLGLPV